MLAEIYRNVFARKLNWTFLWRLWKILRTICIWRGDEDCLKKCFQAHNWPIWQMMKNRKLYGKNRCSLKFYFTKMYFCVLLRRLWNIVKARSNMFWVIGRGKKFSGVVIFSAKETIERWNFGPLMVGEKLSDTNRNQ